MASQRKIQQKTIKKDEDDKEDDGGLERLLAKLNIFEEWLETVNNARIEDNMRKQKEDQEFKAIQAKHSQDEIKQEPAADPTPTDQARKPVN